MRENKFDCDVNPFGILYTIRYLCRKLLTILLRVSTTDPMICSFTKNVTIAICTMVFRLPIRKWYLILSIPVWAKASQRLAQTEVLIITFGTAWVYYLQSTREVVSNCHKMPAKTFVREKLTVNDIGKPILRWLLLQQCSPNLRLLFTVSPIRHVKDGLHENQLSKATLLLAVDELTESGFPNGFLLPAYEIVMDELRIIVSTPMIWFILPHWQFNIYGSVFVNCIFRLTRFN